jgi:uncharacterized protein (DUF924 family)
VSGPDDILRFWFSDRAEKHWFKSSDAFDAEIRQKFEVTAMELAAQQATRNSAHDWEKQSPDAHLALVIALDQFPRNMYRDTAAAFAWDRFALVAAKRMVERKTDIHLSQKQRPFAYMPFMHSEDLADQDECVRLCDARLDDSNTLKFAHIHRDIILRFGRFPHRNRILGRDTQPEERAFLDDGGFSG